MSDFLGEARVRIRPDTSTFAAELQTDVIAATVAASESATDAAKRASATAKEAGVSVKNLATSIQKLTVAQNANRKVADKAAAALGKITGTNDKLAIAQERVTRATALQAEATRALTRSKMAAEIAIKAEAGAIAAGEKEVLADVESSRAAAQKAVELAEANLAAANAFKEKAVAAEAAAKADETAATAAVGGIKGNVGAAAAAAAAQSRGIPVSAPSTKGVVEESTKQGAAASKQAAKTRDLTRAQNANALTAEKMAFATGEITNITNKLDLAQERAHRSTAALTQADKAVERSRVALTVTEEKLVEARRVGTAAAVEAADADVLAARAALKLAEDNQLAALSHDKKTQAALRDAEAEAKHASQLAFARRGVLATLASFAGLRGATLAANTAFIAGAAGLIAFGKSLQVFTNFETQLNVLRVTTGATSDEMDRVSATAVQLGADLTLPGVSAGDAADAMLELAKAGLSVDDAIAGARGVLQLATAANISNADATNLAAAALNAFGLAGDQATRVADTLANAANAAQGSISDMGLGLQQAAAVGRQVGLSLEDTTVFLTALTRAGIRGSDAGTSLRTALLRLINPTKKIQKVFDELGLSLRDAEGNLRPDFFVNLGIALQGLSKEQRDQKIATLGGADAIRSLSILSRQSIGDLIGLRKEIRQQGTASDVAAARMQGLSGAGKQLGNTLEQIGLSIGRTVGPGLEGFVHNLNASITAMSQSPQVAAVLSQGVDAVAVSFNTLGTVLTTVGPLIGATLGVVSKVGTTFGVGPILATVAAFKLLPPVFGAVGSASRGISGQIDKTKTAMVRLQAETAGMTGTQAALRASLTRTGTALSALATSPTAITLGLAALAGGILFLVTRSSQLDNALKNLRGSLNEVNSTAAALTSTTQQLGDAMANVNTEKLAVETSKLGVQQAKIALQNTTAAKGSLERAQLENQLAVSIDNLKNAEARLATTRQQANLLSEQQRQLAIENRDARAKEAADIGNVIKQLEHEALSRKNLRIRGPGQGEQAILNAEAAGRQRIIDKLKEQAAEEAKGADAAGLNSAKRLRALAAIIQTLNKVPTQHEIDVFVAAPSLDIALRNIVEAMGLSGTQAGKDFITNVKNALKAQARTATVPTMGEIIAGFDEQWKQGGTQHGKDYTNAFADAAKANKDKVVAAVQEILDAADKKIKAIDSKSLDLRIAGAFTPQAQLAQLLAKKKAQETKVSNLEKQQSLGAATQEQVDQAKSDLADTVDAITTIQKQIKDSADQAAKDIQQKRDEADDAIIKAFTSGKKRTRLDNLLSRAEGTSGLGDDIKFNKMLVALLRQQIKEAKKTIKNLEKRRDFIVETTKTIIQIQNQIKADKEKQREALRQKREDRQTEIGARIDANIEFAQIKEDAAAEIRAHKAKIHFLRQQQKRLIQEKGQRAKNTAAYLQLRNQIAAEQKAIADLRKQKKELDRESAKMIFEFLQTQQSFTANLLGNLFPTDINLTSPGGGTGPGGTGLGNAPTAAAAAAAAREQQRNLVSPFEHGRGQLPGSRLGPEAAIADAKSKGPSRAQADTQISLLREIKDILLGNHKGNSRNHPRAAHQRGVAASAFEHGQGHG